MGVRGLGFLSVKQVGADFAHPFADDSAALGEVESFAQQFACAGRDMNAVGQAGGLHAAGKVYCRAPEVVGEFLTADDAGHDRPGVQSDAYG